MARAVVRERRLVAAAAVAALLAGCSVGAGPTFAPGAAGAPATITWWATPFTLNGNDPRRVLIDEFEKAYPSIRVDLITGPTNSDQQRDTLESEVGDRTGVPDVYLGDVEWPATFGHAGLALPLSDHLPRTFWKRFTPGLPEGVTYRGKIYAAPFFTSLAMLYYRPSLLAQVQRTVPTTWQELVDTAEAIQAAGLVKYGFIWQGAPYEGLTCVWTEVMRDAGGQVLNAAGTRSVIDSAQSLAALRFLRDLVRDGVTPPQVTTFEEPDVTRLFDSAQAAFARQWGSAYVTAMTSPVSADVRVAPLPTFAGRPDVHYSTFGGHNLFVNPHTHSLDAALKFVQWLTGVQAQRILATQYSVIPANDAVWSAPGVSSSSPVFAAAGHTTPVSRPNTPAYTAVSSAIFTNVNAAVVGARTPEEALNAADRQIDTALLGGSP